MGVRMRPELGQQPTARGGAGVNDVEVSHMEVDAAEKLLEAGVSSAANRSMWVACSADVSGNGAQMEHDGPGKAVL